MEKDIGRISKNDNADIVIRIDDFGGRKGLTIREFVTGDRYTGFTKSGVKISGKDFPKFKEMINSISEEDMKETESEIEKSDEKLQRGQETLDRSIKKDPTEKIKRDNRIQDMEKMIEEEEDQIKKLEGELPDY